MVWHDHITEQGEFELQADLSEDFDGDVSISDKSEEFAALKAGEGVDRLRSHLKRNEGRGGR